MKILSSIIIGLLLLLIGLLKNNGYLDFGELNLFGVSALGQANFSFITKMIDKLLYIPNSIYNIYSDELLEYIKNYNISGKQMELGFVFLFYFLLSIIILSASNIFNYDRDKKQFIILVVIIYFVLVYFLDFKEVPEIIKFLFNH